MADEELLQNKNHLSYNIVFEWCKWRQFIGYFKQILPIIFGLIAWHRVIHVDFKKANLKNTVSPVYIGIQAKRD